MDKARKKEITEIISKLDEFRAKLEEWHSELEGEFEDRSESYQESDKGEQDRMVMDQIEEAATNLEGAIEALGGV